MTLPYISCVSTTIVVEPIRFKYRLNCVIYDVVRQFPYEKMAKQTEFLSAVDTVAKNLGYNSLKDEQKVILQELLKIRDVFAVLPTGYGKSMCYISLPLVYDKIYGELSTVVVVTPLTAIIKDQVML